MWHTRPLGIGFANAALTDDQGLPSLARAITGVGIDGPVTQIAVVQVVLCNSAHGLKVR